LEHFSNSQDWSALVGLQSIFWEPLAWTAQSLRGLDGPILHSVVQRIWGNMWII
jgi:hypothetical protein